MGLPRIGINDDLSIPIWMHVPSHKISHLTFGHDMLMQCEPMDEFIYYLAGDYSKDEKERLLLQQFKSSASVTVTYNKNTIGVRRDTLNHTSLIRAIPKEIRQSNVGELSKITEIDKINNGGIVICRGHIVSLTYIHRDEIAVLDCSILQNTRKGERVTDIYIGSKLPNMTVEALIKAADNLVGAYMDIAD